MAREPSNGQQEPAAGRLLSVAAALQPAEPKTAGPRQPQALVEARAHLPRAQRGGGGGGRGGGGFGGEAGTVIGWCLSSHSCGEEAGR